MRCWTITSIDDILASVTFEACNSRLHDHTGTTPGHMGPKSRAFVDRCSLFFPDTEHPIKARLSGLCYGTQMDTLQSFTG